LVTAEEGNTPLHTAVKMGLPGIVRPLIEYAPEWVQAKNTFDFTPLEFAEKIVIRRLARLPDFDGQAGPQSRQPGGITRTA
jgi:hypothetical protein